MSNLDIVLRFNNSGLAKHTRDPIEEHLKILRTNKTVGFGKVGKPLSVPTVTQLEFQLNQKTPTSLYLLTKNQKQTHYDCYRCNIVGISAKKNPDFITPDYYQHIKNDFGTWFKISSIEKVNHTVLEKLHLSSSGKTVTEALKSMSSMFVIEGKANEATR